MNEAIRGHKFAKGNSENDQDSLCDGELRTAMGLVDYENVPLISLKSTLRNAAFRYS